MVAAVVGRGVRGDGGHGTKAGGEGAKRGRQRQHLRWWEGRVETVAAAAVLVWRDARGAAVARGTRGGGA